MYSAGSTADRINAKLWRASPPAFHNHIRTVRYQAIDTEHPKANECELLIGISMLKQKQSMVKIKPEEEESNYNVNPN